MNRNETNHLPLLISLTQVKEQEAEWLITDYIPKGQISILAGDGGTGKTTIWCGLAAAVSKGSTVFFAPPLPEGFGERTPGKVLFFSAEDSLSYTLKAKLRKAGANLENIYSVSLKDERFSTIKFGSEVVKDLIKQEQPSLVIFDPIQAFVPPDIQMGQRNAMRNCLNSLIGLGKPMERPF